MVVKERAVKMGGDCCNGSAPVREMTLPEEILALKEYNVPDSVVDRIYKKVMECGEWERKRIESREAVIQDLQESDRNHKAVINALGAYLAIQEARVREV